MRVPVATQAEIVEAVHTSAGLGASYVILLLLSTFIATFGLLSNSTATVIGAMIVAPLMGPILGIALSLVQGDLPAFRRALLAEVVGVALCLTCAIAIARLLGPNQVDLTQSEIVGRTHPTLLDLAIGFAAGLAGSFATVNRKISGSIAGVAIAVALVPPLCVSGLSLGSGQWDSGLGAFLLFLANFLTIQLASSIVFGMAGLGHWENFRRERPLLRAFVFNLVLLLATSYFLARQLFILVEERRAEQVTHRIALRELSRLNGASLDGLQIRLVKQRLEVSILARAPEEIGVATARSLQKTLQQQLGYPVDLRIGTARASYVTPDGHLFLPEKIAPTSQEMLETENQRALSLALQDFPGAELTSLRQLSVQPDGQKLFVMVRSPYLFHARLVAQLQSSALEKLQARRPEQKQLELTVRTSLVQDYTAQGLQSTSLDLPLSEEEDRQRKIELRVALRLSQLKSAELLQVHSSGDENGLYVDLKVRSSQPLKARQIQQWKVALEGELKMPVQLGVEVILGQSFQVR